MVIRDPIDAIRHRIAVSRVVGRCHHVTVSDTLHPGVGPADAPERYKLIERKAAGGEGEVWKARESIGGESFHYAVKIIDGGEQSGTRLDALRMQAALATHLEHPALVK